MPDSIRADMTMITARTNITPEVILLFFQLVYAWKTAIHEMAQHPII